MGFYTAERSMRLAELVLLSHVFILVGVTPSLCPFIYKTTKTEKVRLKQPFLLYLFFFSMIRTHYVRVEGLHINVSDGAAGKRPDLGFVFESSSDLQ